MAVDAASLSRQIEQFILSSPSPAVIEDGEVTFDFSHARYSASSEHGRCLLHLWSAERNVVRRVIEAEQKGNALRLTVLRLGQPKPTRLDIVRDRERRTPTVQRQTRENYQRVLERTLRRNFPDWNVLPFTNKMDLENSFGPIYSRGLLRRGKSAWACIGVNAEEPRSAMDGALTIGLLWLNWLREKHAADAVIEGLKIVVPRGSSQVIRLRAAHLDHALAKFEVWELEERDEFLEHKDVFDRGNISTHLVRCNDDHRVRDRFASAIGRMRELVPHFETAAVNSGELSFRVRGLEFARACTAYTGNSLDLGDAITFGVGPSTTTLTDENAEMLRDMARRLIESRGNRNMPRNPLWRLQPERWLESIVGADVAKLDNRLSPAHVYSQVPAFSASDRAMIDVLCATHDARLAVVELKADEDIHLPMQGLDYWSRVRYHHDRGDFVRYGYFAGKLLSEQPPLLMLVAPALHLHPSTDVLLRYISPEIDCTVLGLDERWRQELRVVFRKRSRLGRARSAY